MLIANINRQGATVLVSPLSALSADLQRRLDDYGLLLKPMHPFEIYTAHHVQRCGSPRAKAGSKMNEAIV